MVDLEEFAEVIHQSQRVRREGRPEGADRLVASIAHEKLSLRGVGELQLQGVLGAGGFAAVFEAFSGDTGRRYALKAIPISEDAPDARTRAVREASLSIPSEHVVNAIAGDYLKLLDGNIVKPEVFLIAFPLVSGKRLSDCATQLSSDERVNVVRGLLTALSACHRSTKKVFHRDLNPKNILVSENGFPRIIDFGLAKIPASGMTEVWFGHMGFSDPAAIFEPERADARTDLYMVGGIIYYMTTNRSPHVDPTTNNDLQMADLHRIYKESSRNRSVKHIPDLIGFNCDFLPAASKLVPRLLHLDREQRPHTVEDVMEVLGFQVPPWQDGRSGRIPLLVIEHGPLSGALIVIDETRPTVIGPDLIPGSGKALPASAEVVIVRGGLALRALPSGEDVSLNGQRLGTAAPPIGLRHGDILRLGSIELRFAYNADLPSHPVAEALLQ